MIVDLHTHLWQSPDQLGSQISAQLRERFVGRLELLDASEQVHEEAMAHVDVSVVLGFTSRYLGAEIPNQLIADYVTQRPDRRIGFAGIDPTDRDAVKRVEAIPSQGLSGITLSPAAQDFHPSDTRAMAVYEACQSLGLPVLLHQGTHYTRDTKMEYARPFLFDAVTRAYPDLKLIVAHCGHPWVEETLTLIGKQPNVFAELSNVIARPWQLYNVLLQAHQLGVMDKLLFGSDFPYMLPSDAIETIYSLNRFTHGTGMPGVPREKLRAIVERETLTVLGIKRGAGATGAGMRAIQPTGQPVQKPETVKENQA